MSKLGIKCTLSRNTGEAPTVTWEPLKLVRDVQVNPAWDEAEANSRDTRVKLSVKTLMALELTVSARVDESDAGFAFLDDAANDDTVVDLLVLNGPVATAGSRGWRAPFQVFGNSEDQSIGNVLYREFTLKPTVHTTKPKRAVVGSGGTITYSEPWAD